MFKKKLGGTELNIIYIELYSYIVIYIYIYIYIVIKVWDWSTAMYTVFDDDRQYT